MSSSKSGEYTSKNEKNSPDIKATTTEIDSSHKARLTQTEVVRSIEGELGSGVGCVEMEGEDFIKPTLTYFSTIVQPSKCSNI